MKTGIFYGSTTGTTADVARRIAKALKVADEDIHDVAKTAPDQLGNYDILILGSSTWGAGEVQDDWYSFLDGAEALDFKGKKTALFGVGDETMSDTFCGALAVIKRRLAPTGTSFFGEYPADVYSFSHSDSLLPDGNFCGLALDEVNHPDLTDKRIDGWVNLLISQE